MKVLIAFLFCLFSSGIARSQSNIAKPKDAKQLSELQYDTNKIAVLPLEEVKGMFGKKIKATRLTNEDLDIVKKLLKGCIDEYNIGKDSASRFSWYIDLKIYRFQYVAFINSKGERKIYINAFCYNDFEDEYQYWKRQLVIVHDGGRFFFHLAISLTKGKYEILSVNGEA